MSTPSEFSAEDAKRIAEEKRNSFKSTMDALQGRVEKQVEQVNALVESAGHQAKKVDKAVHDNPWVWVAGAFALGLAVGLGSRRRRRGRSVRGRNEAGQLVTIEAPRRSLAGFAFGTLGTLLFRRVGEIALDAIEDWRERMANDG